MKNVGGTKVVVVFTVPDKNRGRAMATVQATLEAALDANGMGEILHTPEIIGTEVNKQYYGESLLSVV
jgi:hypothetical protein